MPEFVVHDLDSQSRYPWADLPPEVSGALREHVPEVVEAIIEAIQRDVPAYSRPLEGDFGDAVRRGVEVALNRLLLELPGNDEPALPEQARRVYTGLGKGEARSGRPLEALLGAYRIGARVAFRVISRLGLDAGLDPVLLLPLGEAIFLYIDELSTASIEAFSAEQYRQAGERDRRRAELADQLIAGGLDEAQARTLSMAAAWRLPVDVVVVALPSSRADGLRIALGESALVTTRDEVTVAVLPAPTSGSAQEALHRSLGRRAAWVGPVRAWQQAGSSFRAARSAMITLTPKPRTDGGQVDEGPWRVADHLSALVLRWEPDLVNELAAQRLAPLAELRPSQRQRLVETLSAWLRHQGERNAVAQELHVHRQTVGYRINQLREVFGDQLDDPQVRFELELVLRAGHE